MRKRFTQEQFLEKCKQEANPNLDFSRSVYVNAHTKVEVFCRLHPEQVFYIAPINIYKGVTSCQTCIKNVRQEVAKTQRTTQEQFLEKCKNLAHKNLDFSQSVYVTKKTKIEVRCKKHLEQKFTMVADSIYRGKNGCVACQKERILEIASQSALSQEQFLEKCKQTANKNLDLSKAVYQSAKTKVKLSCKKHPEQVFYMKSWHIYRGQTSCKICKKETRARIANYISLTQEQFLERCKKLAHKNLDFSKVCYQASSKVKLSCKKHPEQVFYMTPGHIYRGQTSCKICQKIRTAEVAKEQTLTQQQFLEKCKTANKNLDLSETVYVSNKTPVKLSCHKHPEKVFYMLPDSIYRGYTGCKSCSTSGTSQKERDLANFIKSIYSGSIITNDRSALNNKELDIYLPEKKLAIEFNGVYWHSDINKPTNYHYEKFKSCKAKGIRLIQIWEDTWDSKQDVVKHFLKQELITLPVENIENTVVVTNLDTKTVREFLNTYHLEGYAKYSYAIALKHKNTKELLAVMTFTKTANNGELLFSRFATKTPIVGSFNTLIDTAKENCVKGLYRAKNSSKARCFIAYTNNETDTGELYKNNGWQRVGIIPISYTYWHKSSMRRVLRSRYNKHQFKTSRKLQHLKGLNLKQLEELNSLYRCYDTGKQKWQLELTT